MLKYRDKNGIKNNNLKKKKKKNLIEDHCYPTPSSCPHLYQKATCAQVGQRNKGKVIKRYFSLYSSLKSSSILYIPSYFKHVLDIPQIISKSDFSVKHYIPKDWSIPYIPSSEKYYGPFGKSFIIILFKCCKNIYE